MILTVDPGLVEWAYAIFDDNGKLVKSDMIKYKTTGKAKQSQEERLWDIFHTINTVETQLFLDRKEITHIVSERQFVDTMQQITGVIRCSAGRLGVTAELYTPAQWRKLATGKGNATEDLVKQTVLDHYPEMFDTSVHEIDCAAIYLAWRKKNA